jgi:hypothetical protein
MQYPSPHHTRGILNILVVFTHFAESVKTIKNVKNGQKEHFRQKMRFLIKAPESDFWPVLAENHGFLSLFCEK